MAQYEDSGYGSVTLAATIAKALRVTVAGALAGLTDQDFGTTMAYGVSGDVVGVSFVNKQGTQKATANGSISAGAKVYTAASGKVSSTQGTGAFLRGIAMEAATADGDIIEIMPLVGDTAGS